MNASNLVVGEIEKPNNSPAGRRHRKAKPKPRRATILHLSAAQIFHHGASTARCNRCDCTERAQLCDLLHPHPPCPNATTDRSVGALCLARPAAAAVLCWFRPDSKLPLAPVPVSHAFPRPVRCLLSSEFQAAMDDASPKIEGGRDECKIIAEIGINHNGSIELCKKLIMAAKVAGA